MVVWQGGVGGASREELAREGNKSGGRAGRARQGGQGRVGKAGWSRQGGLVGLQVPGGIS